MLVDNSIKWIFSRIGLHTDPRDKSFSGTHTTRPLILGSIKYSQSNGFPWLFSTYVNLLARRQLHQENIFWVRSSYRPSREKLLGDPYYETIFSSWPKFNVLNSSLQLRILMKIMTLTPNAWRSLISRKVSTLSEVLVLTLTKKASRWLILLNLFYLKLTLKTRVKSLFHKVFFQSVESIFICLYPIITDPN